MSTESRFLAAVGDAARYSWSFIVTGVIWLIISLVVLRFTTTSVTAVGILIGVVFALAAITEFLVIGLAALFLGMSQIDLAFDRPAPFL
jgi:hypothetical protein